MFIRLNVLILVIVTMFSCVPPNNGPSALTLDITSSVTFPTETNPVPVSFSFNGAVTGFDAGDVTVAHGTLQNFTGSGAA